MQGYLCCAAILMRNHGYDTETRELLEAVGITSVADCRRYKVDDSDIEVLRPIIKEIQRRAKS